MGGLTSGTVVRGWFLFGKVPLPGRSKEIWILVRIVEGIEKHESCQYVSDKTAPPKSAQQNGNYKTLLSLTSCAIPHSKDITNREASLSLGACTVC